MAGLVPKIYNKEGKMSDKALTLDMASELNKQLFRRGATVELAQKNLIENLANIDKVANLIKGEEVFLTSFLVTASPFFANEEAKSNYGYPQGYAVKPVYEQLVELSKHLNGLNPSSVLARSKELPVLPAGAEGWFVVPRWENVASSYNDAVEKVLDLIGKTRTLYNSHKGAL